MAANLYYTPSTYSSSTTGTFSFWIKRGKLSSEGNTVIWSNTSTNDNNRTYFSINSDDKIRVSVQYSGSDDDNLTNAQFRDIFGWMHIVIRLDSTQGTAANRCVIWVNGEQQSMSSNAGTPSGNITAFQTSLSNSHYWGGIYGSTSGLDNGYLSQCVYCDGQAYSASNFGETDVTTGEWKPKSDLSGLTFGNNGYWLKFENSANIGLDSSGNSNNFTNNSSEVLQVADNPSNVFATQNILDSLFPTTSVDWAFSHGNNQVVSGRGSNSSTGYSYNNATIAVSKGKFYWEVKPTNVGGSSFIGIISEGQLYNQNLNEITNSNAYAWTIRNSNGNIRNNNTNITYAASYTANDIISVALDLDNNKIYWAKNGVWGNGSGAWGSSTFDAAVGAVTITAPASTKNGHYFPTLGASDYATSSTFQTNFGNGYFGSTAISSAGTNASGNGIFEYDVPANFTALSTKGLNL